MGTAWVPKGLGLAESLPFPSTDPQRLGLGWDTFSLHEAPEIVGLFVIAISLP